MTIRASRLMSAAFVVLIASAPALISCGGTPDTTETPTASLPRWEGDLRDLYPDQIDPAVFGLVAPTKASRSDKILLSRATSADVVGRARFKDVESHTRGTANDPVYVLRIQFANPPLATPRVDQSEFEVIIPPNNEAYKMVSLLDNRIKERQFVAVVKRFQGANPDDEAAVHFYLYPVETGVEEVVQEALALHDVKNQ